MTMELEPHHIHQVSATTAQLVGQMAAHVHGLAPYAGGDRTAFEDLAAALDALAQQANTATIIVDDCLAHAANSTGPAALAPLAVSHFNVASELMTSLKTTLDAAVAIYARACDALADSASVAEEHLDRRPAGAAGPINAVALAQRARALKRTLSTSTHAG